MNSPPNANPLSPALDLAGLRLLHLADSALPIGSLSHSFGIETLAAEGILTPSGLDEFFRAYIEEAGLVEAVFCRAGWRLAGASERRFPADRWREINDFLSALKLSRESRTASAALGENFLRAVLACGDFPLLRQALDGQAGANGKRTAIHHSPAFGLACGSLGIGEDGAALAYLHQTILGLVSACQRLMPLGQKGAMRLLWDLKPVMIEAAERSRTCGIDEVSCFMPQLDWGSMEHPALTTRLFIS